MISAVDAVPAGAWGDMEAVCGDGGGGGMEARATSLLARGLQRRQRRGRMRRPRRATRRRRVRVGRRWRRHERRTRCTDKQSVQTRGRVGRGGGMREKVFVPTGFGFWV